ncbi:MAG TPA: IS5 family transposase [Acidimicrobiales bacterium]|nr:IS5 family transposase [Acidimicrobiales bacterium]
MRALQAGVFDAVWAQVEPLLPAREDGHPLGCHRPRVPDRVCLFAMLVRLVTGCSWMDAEALVGGEVSDTTLRSRRDEWVAAGVFDQLVEVMLAAYDSAVGLAPAEAAVDGSAHKAPCGGEGTGRNPVDRGKLGWKWSVATDANGIPMGWAIDGANRHDSKLLEATLEAVDDQGLLDEIEVLYLDRGYDKNNNVRATAAAAGIDHLAVSQVRPRQPRRRQEPSKVPLGKRWVVERTNSWFSNYGQLRRNTDRKTAHRAAQLSFVVAILLTIKLIDRGHLPRP